MKDNTVTNQYIKIHVNHSHTHKIVKSSLYEEDVDKAYDTCLEKKYFDL